MTVIKRSPWAKKHIRVAVNTYPDSFARAAKYLNEEEPRKGYKMTAQWLRALVGQMDSSELDNDYDRVRELARSRNFSAENSRLRKDNRALADAVGTRQDFLDAFDTLAVRLNERPPIEYQVHGYGQGKGLTVEILLSDLQIGKLSPGYNTAVGLARLSEFGKSAVRQVEQKVASGYRIERIVLALIGDIIESDKKHSNSARATDTSTAEQIFDAWEGIFTRVLEPIARIGVPTEVLGITGNHDHDDHGLNMFEPGKNHLSWPIYRGLEVMCRRLGYTNVHFTIPDGSYATTEIYGQIVLYEHGVGVAATETAMKAHKIKRAEQEKKHITYFRMGDKHTVTSFNSGQLIVNGAFFGAQAGGTEYSGIAGYSSNAAQWMGFHVAREDNRLTLWDTFIIQLDHIGE